MSIQPGSGRALFFYCATGCSAFIILVAMVDALLVVAFFFLGHGLGSAFFSGMLESGALPSMAAVEALSLVSAVLMVLAVLFARYAVRFLLLLCRKKNVRTVGRKGRGRK